MAMLVGWKLRRRVVRVVAVALLAAMLPGVAEPPTGVSRVRCT